MGETSKFPQGLKRRHFLLGGLLGLIAIIGCANPTASAVPVAASKYAVTYDANGATGGSAPVGSGNYLKGASVTVLGNIGNLVKTGMFFSGWNTKADGSGTGYGAGSRFTMGSSDVKLYAAWTTAPVSVTGVSLVPTILNMIAGGSTAGLTATIAPANATNTGVSWSSAAPAVASVDGSGVVSPLAAGTTTITVTTADGGKTAVCTVTVSSVAVTGVSVHPTTLNMVAGGATGPLTAIFAPVNATNTNVTWASSNAGVASVNGSGVVTPVSVGTATITVTTVDGNKTATCAVTVGSTPVLVTGVSLSPTTLNLFAGGSVGNLIATIAPANATDTNVTWASSNAGIASVNGSGVVTPVSAGTATITVTTVDGGKTATCAVTNTVPVAGVSISPLTLDLIIGGSTSTLTPIFAPANATNTSVSWLSDTPAVATVNSSGLVTPASIGSATITVTTADGGKTATCAVTVHPMPVSGVSLSPTTLSLIVGGSASSLTATVAPANATNANVTWASSPAGVASVNSSGLVSPVSAGTATITVTTVDGGKTATCAVDVTIPPVALGTAGNYAILAQSGIDIGATGFVTGDIGVSPIGYAAMTGFGLSPAVPSGSNTLATSSLVSGNAYASDYTSPTPGNLTAAVTAMHSAYADALGRASPNGTDIGTGGEIGGRSFSPGLYNWTTAVTISTDLTLSGGPNDVYIFQVNGALTLGTGINVLLPGGALPKNIFWQINGAASLNSNSHFEGVLLGNAAITVGAGATMNSRLLSWTAVTVGTGHVTQPAP